MIASCTRNRIGITVKAAKVAANTTPAEVITPPVTDNILEGITRRSIIELAKSELGLEVVERSIDRTELYIAEELFMTGTAAQVVAVTRVDFRSVGSGAMGPVTDELRRRFEDILRGRDPKYAKWTVLVPQQ